MTNPRTWWILQSLGRKPDDYDVATTGLLYYPGRGFEVRTPVEGWYHDWQEGSPLRCRDWDRFRDPRATTYASYTALQHARETYVDGLLASDGVTGSERPLAPAWVAALDGVLGTLRYPFHGLQMVASYVGSMAPGGRIVVACALQAADEVRRVQRVAYRMRQLQDARAGFGDGSRAVWERHPAWQPLRELIEQLLVTWDWGEALTALNLVVKAHLDALFMLHLGALARDAGDDVLHRVLRSLHDDCEWHLAWSRALVQALLEDDTANGPALAAWIERWRLRVAVAVRALAPVFEAMPGAGPFEAVAARIEREAAEAWVALGLPVGGGAP